MIFALALIVAGVLIALSQPDRLLVALGGIAAGVWVALIMWQWVRYRHALRACYTLDTNGVLVDSKSDTKRLLWSDFDSAEYLLIPGMLRLRSKALAEPVFLFLDNGWRGTTERNRVARQLVASHMADRFRKSWAL